jgi:RNA polymerase sigma-70 factor, ECF subfamily
VQPAADSLRTFDTERLRQRDPATIERQYQLHRSLLERAARRAGFRGADAEELVQAVWATFLEVVPRFEGRSQVRTFLFGILRREAAEARRERGRAAPTEPSTLDRTIDVRADAHDALAEAKLGQAVRGCVSQLPSTERRAVELKLLAERDTASVGRELGVTANYLGVLLHRARAHLRLCLEPHVP